MPGRRLSSEAISGVKGSTVTPSFPAPPALGPASLCSPVFVLAAANLAALQQLIHNRAGHVGRNCEADSDIGAAGARQNLRIDPDQFTHGIHERATRVALIDRRVGLQKVFKVATPYAGSGPAFRADDAHRHGLAHAEGITNS